MPDAKIIICLRDPTDLVRSLYNYRIATGQIRERSLDDLLTAEDALRPRSDERIPTRALFKRAAEHGRNVRRYLEAFPRSRLHFVFADDLRRRPEDVLKELARFLDIRAFPAADVEQANVTGMQRSYTFGRLIAWRPPVLTPLAYKLPKQWRSGAYRALARLNRSASPPPSLSADQENRLREYFVDDVRELMGQTDRDLRHWLPNG